MPSTVGGAQGGVATNPGAGSGGALGAGISGSKGDASAGSAESCSCVVAGRAEGDLSRFSLLLLLVGFGLVFRRHLG
jgi:hypothetical protein